MSAKELSAAIRKGSTLASKANAQNKIIRQLFQYRYGVDYSDVDCDLLIDCVDYGQGEPVTIKELDADMKAKGYTVVNQKTAGQDKQP